MNYNYTDFYVLYEGHPRYKGDILEEDDIINIVTQKYQSVILTEKGTILGDPNFGVNLKSLLNDTRVPSEVVESMIEEQLAIYIPELSGLNYELNVEFEFDEERYRDVMVVEFKFKDVELYNIVY